MKDKLLIPEAPLQTLPTLVSKLGLKEAMVLQQLHYRLLNTPYKRDGYPWYRHTYANWNKQFPFYSEKTISRAFLTLEDENIIISSQEYNPAKVMKTKWYRIDYVELYRILGYNYDPVSQTLIGFKTKPAVQLEEDLNSEEDADPPHAIEGQKDLANSTNDSSTVRQLSCQVQDKNMPSIKEELKEEFKEEINKKDIVEMNLDAVSEIIHYLNQKTNRNYQVKNKSTQRFINARLKDGYQLEDFKRVIDLKVMQWLHDPKMKPSLKPNTLFNPTNFENYLVESKENQTMNTKPEIKPVVLDFNLGEED